MFNYQKQLLYWEKVQSEVVSLNIHRIFILSCVAFPVHLVHIFLFWEALSPADSAVSVQWKKSIMALHAGMSIVVLISGGLAYKLKKGELTNSRGARLLQNGTVFCWLLFGLLLYQADHLVEAGITPFLLMSLGTAVCFLLTPVVALVQYTIAFSCFYVLLSLNSYSEDVLLSLQVNGMSLFVISLGVSVLNWRSQGIRFSQQQQIAYQNKILEQQNKELEQSASYDFLTGLPNRVMFMKEIEKLQGQYIHSSLLVLDVDYFKQINDQYGHPAGDYVLTKLAALLSNSIGAAGTAARFGGEEFVLLLRGENVEAGLRLAEVLRQQIQESPFVYENQAIAVTASIGVSALNSAEPKFFPNSYYKADQALYKAKAQGRNQVACVFE